MWNYNCFCWWGKFCCGINRWNLCRWLLWNVISIKYIHNHYETIFDGNIRSCGHFLNANNLKNPYIIPNGINKLSMKSLFFFCVLFSTQNLMYLFQILLMISRKCMKNHMVDICSWQVWFRSHHHYMIKNKIKHLCLKCFNLIDSLKMSIVYG